MTQRQVTLEGGAPWGFRMHGGVDLKTPLKVSRVNPGSKASQRGVREGDLITSINDESTRNLTNNEAHNLLKRSGSTLKLGLNEVIEGSPKKRQYRTIHHETHQETVKRSSISYTLKQTIERSSSRKPNNEFEAFKSNEFINGQETKQNGRDITVVTNIPVSQKSTPSSSSASTPSTLVPEGKNTSDHAIASRQSSYSNCSSIPDEGSQRENQDYPSLESQEMNDGEERMSKSKKRRQRRKNLLNRTISHESQTQSDVETEGTVLESNSTENVNEIVLEPTSKNLEILRLKRIEHKYKVESPKELKLDQIKSSEKKKLKAKSKSLDDDDLLKIQELSEASESEDTKYQSNVIISEASSEENLLDDSDSDSLRKKRSLASISFQLNDDNKLEATSLISPEEEQALRNFLGGLNLVTSPEESAKDLYERTTGLNDPKSKKLQKRKELEEYFIPIAQNPRYLDAISEEASDISDKECSGSTKKVQHIKQSTPENDLGQNNLTRETAIVKPILIEAKILETLGEGICSTNVVPTSEEKAEVVYLPDDSSTSSNLSNDSDDDTSEEKEDLVNKDVDSLDDKFDQKSSNKQSKSDSKSNVTADEKELKNTKIDDARNKRFDFHVGSEETISTVVSSHTSSSTKVSHNESTNDKVVVSKLTPSVTSNGIFSKSDKNTDAKVIFDYTRVPNILKEKEPFDNNSKGTTKELVKKESLGDKNEKAIAENTNKKDSKLDKELNNIEGNAKNSKVLHSEARSISAVHMSKKTVNGHIDNAEYRKVKVDEVCKNGDVEVKKDFEEYTTKPDKVNGEEISNKSSGYSSVIKKTDLNNTDVLNLDSKSESALKKESIRSGLDTISNLKPSNDHASAKTEISNSQISVEYKEVLADEISKQEKVQTITEDTSKTSEVNKVKKHCEEYTTKPDKVIGEEISNKSSEDTSVTKKTDSKSESAFKKESICSGLDTNLNLKPSNDHASAKTEISNSQISVEYREVLADEISKQEKVQTITENTSKTNEVNSKNIEDLAVKTSNLIDTIRKTNIINDESIKETNIECENSAVSKEAIASTNSALNASNNVTSSKKEIIKSSNSSSENFVSESNEESILKHVIMTSQDSNKTDSQKLLEFESIWKLNNEIKDKISKQELIGPTFRKSKSPATDFGSPVPIVMNCEEELPSKSFIQKRLKEFSQENCKLTEERKHSKMLGPNTVHHGACISPEPPQRECRSLIASRIRAFSNGLHQDSKSQNEESILKKIITSDDKNNNSAKLDNQISEVVKHKVKPQKVEDNLKEENNINLETIIPINVDNDAQDVVNQEEGSILKRILSCHAESESEKDTKEESNNEIIIPVTIERPEYKETIIPIQLEALRESHNPTKSTVEKIIPISLEKIKSEINEAEEKFDSKIGSKERLIPIEIKNDEKETVKTETENPNDLTKEGIKNISRSLINLVEKKQHKKEDNSINNKSVEIVQEISPNNKTINVEEMEEIKNEPPVPPHRTKSTVEKIIPISLEKINSEINEGKEKVASKMGSKERLIPIEIKNNKKETVKTETENPNDLTKEDIKNISRSLINLVEKKRHKKDNSINNKSVEIVREIIPNNKTINVEKKEEIKNEPPIPPPRRSKAILLKHRKEIIQKIPNKEDIPVSSDITYTNVISPPRPASASSDSSCSEESSSRCTAKYNPNSSIADVASITKDEEMFEPMTLRDIVLKVLMSLPFGGEILKELAEVSKTIEHFTNKLPFKGVGNNDKTNIVLEREETMPGSWYTQKDVARNSYEDERRKIIELHQKFLTRRKYSEDSNIPQNVTDDRVQITAIDNREMQVTSPNRLLTIIREEPEATSDLTYSEDNSDQRLKAKNLGEWLTLARNKSKSTSNLDSTIIPINNLRRTIASAQNEHAKFSNTRRFSLPQEIYEKQLIHIMEKEREIQRELEKLEEEKMKLRAEIAPSRQKEFQVDDFYVSKKGDFAEIREDATGKKERPASMPVFPTEYFRQQMYEEYMDKFSEREERKQQKVIKISSSNDLEQDKDKTKEIIHPVEIEQEFMDRVKEKLKKNRVLSSDESFEAKKHDEISSKDEAPVIVLDGDKVKGIETLPRHLQEFVDDLTTQQQDDCIWSPGQPRRPPSPPQTKQYQRTDSKNSQSQNDPVSPIWTPKSANSSPTVERKEFRPVTYVSPVLSRKTRTRSESIPIPNSTTSEPPWKLPEGASDGALNLSSTLDRRLPTSQSSPGFGSFSTSPRLPKAQNPTITLLQKAREGQLPRGAHYIDQDRRPPNDRPPIKYPGEVLYHIKNEYTSESDSERPRKMADLTPRKFEGVGPTTKDGMPLILRSEVKDKDQSKWYKRMYDTIHKQKPHRDEYVTIRYKQKRAQYPYTSGYLSEPEPGAYDSDFSDYKYQTLDRRRIPQTQHYISNHSTMPRSVPDNRSYSSSDIIKNTQEKYNNQPGRIENYRPGHSSISEKEAKQWWDEVMDIFDGHLEQQNRVPPQKPRSFINQALKESGYESDSTLVFKRKEETAASQLGPREQREAYKIIQKGGDVPFQGLRKPAPERPKETDLVEFFPISPTLTKIRIHKSIIPPKEFSVPEQDFFCYPATVHHSNKTFSNFKRSAPSSVNIPTPPRVPTPPPSPPKRKSSRNNTTLRLISTMKVKTERSSPISNRHETCFTSGPSVDRSKVNYLRDKITCKLSPGPKRKGESSSKLSVVKKISASPEMKSKISSTLITSRDPKSSVRKVQSSTKISPDKLQTRGLYKSGSTGSIISKKSSTESLSSRTSTPVRTFGTEKRKFDLTLPLINPKSKLSKTSSEELLSPTEVKKGIKNISASNTHYKESTALLSSAKFSNENKSLPIKVGITEKGKNILKSSIKKSVGASPKVSRRATVHSPCQSTSSERSRLKSSTESLNTPKSTRKSAISSLKPKLKTEDRKTQHKSKKDQINDSLKQNSKKCLSKARGADVAKKLDTIGASEITQQKQAIESNHFFRNLFLRNVKHSASFTLPKNSWLVEKTNQLTRRRSSISEPSIGAMKIYLKHTRPVSDSRFISLDIIRSRSASPKSVTFSDNVGKETTGVSKRSKSLPSKIVFSQTSRPVSPVITKRRRSPILKPQSRDNLVTIRRSPSPPNKIVLSQTSRPVSPVITRKPRSPILKHPHRDNFAIVRQSPSPQTKLFFSETNRPISPEVKRRVRTESPPVSPMLPRSPSCRKIMQIKQQQTYEHNRPQELTLYTCPELKHSTTSLDSFRSEDYQVYLKDLVFDKSEKFKDLNHFYSDIEKVGQLEQKFSSKPRKKCENEIIDYDRWMEVRTRERAEHELKHLYSHLKSHEKEKGFLFLPKDVERYRWKKELDRGLRIKEKSVENIKEEFERLKKEESDRECAKRREIAYSKDTYKPLWRGNSVVNLASILTERRSQSEGRVKTARQKLLDSERLLTHGIGSRIWSSLSMEQVNNLKKQLQEIYGDDQPKEVVDSAVKDYIVEVPKEVEHIYVPQLTVRRNSESSKHDLMSEDEKKMISQTISREVLEKISKRRKEDKLALPLVIGKEVLGAKATEEANIKPSPKKEEPQKPLVKTNALSTPKQNSVSETESASTDESTKTVINVKDVQKKVEYFEKAKEIESYVPTIHKPAEDGSSNSEEASSPTELTKPSEPESKVIHQSKSCQNFKEYFGESELVKFATLPLSATRKSDYSYTRKPHLRALDISPIRTISEANSNDSLNRSRSASPYCEEAKALAKKGEVKKLRKQFEFFEDFFGEKKLKRSRSENDLRVYGHVDDLRRKYEYPVHSGRGRSRLKRGGMVSPVWLRAEDRYMPHINIISKIASLYSFSKHRTDKESSRSMEELAEILGCPIGEVEKMKEKFDRMREHEEQISLMGHMYTSSPNLRELRDITPYLTANWIAHRFPRSEDNTRSVSSPDTSIASRDISLVRRDRHRPKSSSPFKKGPTLIQVEERPKEWCGTSSRYTKEPDLPPPPPPPKSQGGVRSQEQESPRKYVENEVTIHYKTPVRTEIKEYVSEDELAHRQAEIMKKIYEEERKRKYLQVSKSMQELQDMKSRRHTDNFVPSQKSPISLNRYDDFDDLTTPTKTRTRSPEPRLVAKALFNFVGQTARELTFRKGDLIYVRRQVDKNWYEGELNAMVGLFPVNYVEIVPYEGIKTTPRKAHEGQARAKYNFVAQTHLELSLAKGELVTITRRVDDNWFEGKIGGRKGIFPVAYVDVLIDPSGPLPPSTKPVASPAAHSMLLNGSAQGKESMGSHLYTPNMPTPVTNRDNGYHHAKPIQLTGTGTYSTLPKKTNRSPIDQALHIETQAEPIPYRALYKYTPQNDDELELLEGDTVYVLEKCDDGWYVGSSDRTGAFGTFPGNYVEKI